MQTKIINKIFEIFDSLNPVPKTELYYDNHFTLLVAIILSAQSTDASVNKATKELFIHYDTPKKMLDLGEERLKKYIKIIGLYNAKAKNIIATSEALIQKYDSKVPDNFEELIKLPGVGRKTANVLLNCAHNLPTMPVDTHVFRVSNRLGLTCEKTPEKVEYKLLEIIPLKWLNNAHHWLVLHGRYVCKARQPLCDSCPVKQYCQYYLDSKSLKLKS